jgi:signal transduction histidine kinase
MSTALLRQAIADHRAGGWGKLEARAQPHPDEVRLGAPSDGVGAGSRNITASGRGAGLRNIAASGRGAADRA